VPRRAQPPPPPPPIPVPHGLKDLRDRQLQHWSNLPAGALGVIMGFLRRVPQQHRKAWSEHVRQLLAAGPSFEEEYDRDVAMALVAKMVVRFDPRRGGKHSDQGRVQHVRVAWEELQAYPTKAVNPAHRARYLKDRLPSLLVRLSEERCSGACPAKTTGPSETELQAWAKYRGVRDVAVAVVAYHHGQSAATMLTLLKRSRRLSRKYRSAPESVTRPVFMRSAGDGGSRWPAGP
jgi:hypothetical protein